MISVTGRNWEQKNTKKNSIEKIKQDFDFSDTVAKLILTRKFDETELNSINNRLFLNNVFLKNEDVENSLNIIIEAINNKKKFVFWVIMTSMAQLLHLYL